jgi:hypothetical protein
VYPMEKRHVGKKHKRAIAFNQMHALFAAEVYSFLTNRTLSNTAVHPDTANASFGTVSHHPFSVSGRGEYQRSLGGRLNFLHAGEAPPGLHCTHGRIHRNHVITPVTHLAEERHFLHSGLVALNV